MKYQRNDLCSIVPVGELNRMAMPLLERLCELAVRGRSAGSVVEAFSNDRERTRGGTAVVNCGARHLGIWSRVALWPRVVYGMVRCGGPQKRGEIADLGATAMPVLSGFICKNIRITVGMR